MISLAKWRNKRQLLWYLKWFDKKIIQLLLGHLKIAIDKASASNAPILELRGWLDSIPFNTDGVRETRHAIHPVHMESVDRIDRLEALLSQIENVKKGTFLKIIGEIKSASSDELARVIERDKNQEIYIVANLLGTLNNEKKKWEEVDALVDNFLSNPHKNAPRKLYDETLQHFRDKSKVGLSELNKAIGLLRKGELLLERQFEKYK